MSAKKHAVLSGSLFLLVLIVHFLKLVPTPETSQISLPGRPVIASTPITIRLDELIKKSQELHTRPHAEIKYGISTVDLVYGLADPTGKYYVARSVLAPKIPLAGWVYRIKDVSNEDGVLKIRVASLELTIFGIPLAFYLAVSLIRLVQGATKVGNGVLEGEE